MKLRRIIFFILVIINCITIFYYSNQVADTSSGSSGRVVNFLDEKFHITKGMDKNEAETFKSEVLQPIVRKTAHFTLYTLLGLFIMNFVLTYNGTTYQKGLLSFILGVIYAISDEIHQIFIEGRSCEFRDVCIDSLGILTGILLTVFVMLLIRKIKRQKYYLFQVLEDILVNCCN